MDVTTMLAVVCTAYTIIAGYMLVMRAEVYWAPTENPAPSVPGRIVQWVKAVVYFIGGLTCGATSGVVLAVVLDWYWSVCW